MVHFIQKILYILFPMLSCGLHPTMESKEDFLQRVLNISSKTQFEFISVPKGDVSFFSLSPQATLQLDNSDSVNADYPTKIIIHGWRQNVGIDYVKNMADFYHRKGNYSILAVDWSKFAVTDYINAASTTRSIGYIVGDFIYSIFQKYPNFLNNLHLIGHSLSGHICGFVGKRIMEYTKASVKIDRITGLDVSRPLFEIPLQKRCDSRLCVLDATVVDLIHTDIGFYGLNRAFGHFDFYVNNGGPIQPKCITFPADAITKDAELCSHREAITYFMRTILEPKKYLAEKCIGGATAGKAYMGEEISRNATTGSYCIKIE